MSGSTCNNIFLPNPRVAGLGPIRYETSVTQFFMSYELAVPGAISHRAFRLGKPCTTIFGAFVSRDGGIESSQLCEEQNVSEWEGMQTPAQQSWIHKVSRLSRSQPEFLGLMHTSMLKGVSGNGTVDTLGLPLSIYVTPADVHDTRGARCLLAGLAPLVPRLKKIWADGASARAGVVRLVQS